MSQQIKLTEGAIEREVAPITPAKVEAGEPVAWTENFYTSDDGKYFTGLWGSSPGKWRMTYSEEETCTLLEGVVVLTGKDGVAHTYHAGDSFVIPRGFDGTWETVETCKKVYAIYER